MLGMFVSPVGADGGEIEVTFTADDMGLSVSSSKDISNVIVELCDGTMHKHDGLNGHRFEHREDQKIVGVWVKSGNNGAGGDAPSGAGERFDNDGVSCEDAPDEPGPTPTSSAPPPATSEPSPPPASSSPPPSSTDAEITVTFTTDDKGFTVSSSKDISNVIVELCDGTMHKHDGLNGPSFEHREDQKILRVWVKSGDNGAGGDAPPGAGERFDNHGVVCDDAPQPTGEQPPSSSTPPPATSPTQPPAGSPPAATTSHAPPPSSENPPSGSEGAPSPTTSGPNVTPTTPIPVFPSGAAVLVAMVGSLGGAFLLLRRR